MSQGSNKIFYFSNKDKLALGMGLLAALSVRLVGVIYLAEIICFILFLFVLPKLKLDIRFQKLILFLILWIIGCILSNIFNETSTLNFVKGFFFKAAIIPCLIALFWLLQDKPERILFWEFGNAISLLVSLYIFPSVIVEEFRVCGTDVAIYYHLPLIYSIAHIVYYNGFKRLGLLCEFSSGIISLFFMSRNPFIISTMAGIVTIFYASHQNEKTIKKIRLLGLAILIMVGGFIVKTSYSYAASQGILGEEAYLKYIKQNNDSGKFGIFSGRLDFFGALYAITQKPIIGYGDYAKDYGDLKGEFTRKYFVTELSSYNQRTGNVNYVYGHSHILGAWVYSGILALPFWIYCLYLTWLFFRHCLPQQKGLLLYGASVCFSNFWNLFFSPFSARLSLISYIFFIVLLQQLNDNSSQYQMPGKMGNNA